MGKKKFQFIMSNMEHLDLKIIIGEVLGNSKLNNLQKNSALVRLFNKYYMKLIESYKSE